MRKLLLSLVLCFIALASKAISFTVNGIHYYTIDDERVSVSVDSEWDTANNKMIYHYYTGSLTIPSTVTYDEKTYKVTSVYLWGCSDLTSIKLPGTLEEIAEGGFADCSQLTQITLPESLKKIGGFAFQSCDNLKEITIPASVREIGREAFTLSGIEKMVIKDLKAWCGVKKTGSFISSNTKVFLNEEEIKDLVIPDSVSIIEPNTFNGFKSIETVYIPADVDSIGDNAFLGCTNISKVTTHDVASWCGIHFGNTMILQSGTIMFLSNPVCVSRNLYIGNEQLTELNIPEGVNEIGYSAFERCLGITKISLPSTLRKVGADAFADCTDISIVNITSLQDYCSIDFGNPDSNPFQDYMMNRAWTWMLIDGDYLYEKHVMEIPDGLTEVKANSFAKVDNVGTVIIPASVSKIGRQAFYTSVRNLNTVYINGHITDMGELAFGNCPYIGTLYVNDANPDSIPDNAFYNYYHPSNNVTLGLEYNYNNTRLIVPVGAKVKYESASGWKQFNNIEEYDFSQVAVAGIKQDASGIKESYTLDGRQATPSAGVIIIERLSDGSTRKVLR
ncbi:MAG: leucine-rich repeat domain-containing protein [Bacteroidaceae bacterium]|nr:leucine-rich repeat domain-containing protein [Bacteroidaceae bacterium]